MFWDEESALNDYNDEDWSIWGELTQTVDLWRDTYEEYWGFDVPTQPENVTAEQWEERKRQHQNAEAILEMALALTVSVNPSTPLVLTNDQLKWVRDYFRKHKKSPIARDHIALALARKITSRVGKAEERAFRLVGVLLGRPLSDRAASYVGRATNLYVEGLEVEAALMCRAVLEAALIDRLSEAIHADEEPPPLKDLIKAARDGGVLDSSGVRRALRVKRAGNFIAHEFPRFPEETGEILDAFEAIRELTLILRQLFPEPTFE